MYHAVQEDKVRGEMVAAKFGFIALFCETTLLATNIAVEILDPTFTTSAPFQAKSSYVAAENGQLFITNNTTIGSSNRSDVVGWVFPVGSTSSAALVEILDPTFTISAPFQAQSRYVAAESGQFFIT